MIKKKKKNIFYIASCAILATTVMLLIYVILVATGVIHLKQNKLVFYGNSAEKVYDGEPLSDDGWKLTAGKLQSGHTAFGSTVGSLTVPGETENRLSVWILDRNGSDVTDEYDIECVPGALRVRGIPLTFSSESKSKVYDGKPLTGFECRLLQGTLLPNHQAHYKSIGTITEVGTVPNDMHIYVTNTKTGEDVTYLYDITRENGTLEIHSRCVTVTTASDQKLYDGTPLTNGNFTLVGDFLPGHLGEVNVMGTILEPGEAKNVANVRIRDAEGNDVTSLYEIITEFGTLTVISPPKADDVDKPDDSGGTLDGNDINNPNSGAEKETEYFKILTDYTGALLLRMNHFGDYSYDGWAEAPSGEDPLSLYLVSSALSKSSATANTAELKLLSGCSYLTPYYVEPSAVDSTLTEYSVPFYLYDYRRERSLPALPLEYAELELACREYAYENYLSLPDKTAEDMLGIYRSEVEKDGLNPDTLSGSERILWVESYIKGAAEYNLEFSEYPEDVDTAVYFLTEAKEGVCRHFATSAVAMYRALGIPARYTVGFSVSTLAGEERTVMGDRAHAWVEVYIDGLGWIALDPTGGSNQSDIQLPEPPEDWIPQLNSVLIASDNAQKMYDGSPLTSNNYHIYGLEDGYREEVYFTGSQLEVGSSPNSFSVKIYDADGNDVTGDFQIEKMEGELNVTPVSITVKTSSAEKNYNGTPLTSQEYTLEGDAVDGHKVSVKCLGTVTDPATVENDFEITVTDKNGNDVTSLYTVNREPGLLTVHPIPLIITGEDAEKVYDGTPLTCDLYRAEGGVLPNHSLKFDFTGKRTEPGSESNPFTVQVFNANEEDVTDKYLIESFYGNLTVKNREDEDEIDKDKIIRNITVESLKAEKTYDGTPLTRKGYTITSGNLLPGHRAEMNYTGSQTEAGSSKNTFEIKILDQDGNDATADYLITKVEGMLTVNPITLSVTTGDGTKTYDGTPLVQDLATYVASTEIPKGHTVTLEANGSQTEVGESENGYTFKVTNAEGKDVTHCFEAKDESVGMLTIAPATLTVTTNGDEKIYDGTPLRAEGFTHTGDLAKGHQFSVNVTGARVEPGTSKNSATVKVLDADGADVSKNYDIHVEEGDLTVCPVKLIFTSAHSSKMYDGTPLTEKSDPVMNGMLLSGITPVFEFTGSQTDAGSSQNLFTVELIDKNGVNVSELYDINEVYGTLEVKPIPITVDGGSNEKIYDGTPLNEAIPLPTVGLLDGHDIEIIYNSSLTDAGSIPAAFDVKITDENGEDKTHNYEVTKNTGNLTVTPRELTVYTGSAEAVFDGAPLTCPDWGISSGEVVPGQQLTATVTGIQSVPGISSNTFTWKVLDADGAEVSSKNYNVISEEGKLTLCPGVLTFTSHSADKIYDGTPLTNNSNPDMDGMLLSWLTPVFEFTGSQTVDGTSPNTFTVKLIDGEGEDFSHLYEIIKEYGTLTVEPRELKLYSGSAEKIYDGTPLTCPDWNISSGTVAPGQRLEVSVYSSQTEVGVCDNSFLYKVLDGLGNDVTDCYEIEIDSGTLTVTPRHITVNGGSESKVYDGTPLDSTTPLPTHGLAEGHSIEVIYTASQTEVGWCNANFYVKITDEGGSDKTHNYAVNPIVGKFTVNRRPITISTGSAEKLYDGNPLICEVWNITSGEVAPAQMLAVTVTGTLTEPDKVSNTATAEVLDADGADVTRNYMISFEEGTLTVHPLELTFTSHSADKVYDGTPLTNESDPTMEGYLLPGFTPVFEFTGSLTDVGTSRNYFTVKLIDGEGNDVSNIYKIIYNYGQLTVNRREITVCSKSAEKIYDGTPLTCHEWEITSGEVAPGQRLVVTVTGTRSLPGKSTNTFTWKVLDADGAEVNSVNYLFTAKQGTLTVCPRTLTFTSHSDNKIYDGTPLIKTSTPDMDGMLLSGITPFFEFTGSQTVAGSSDNIFTVKLFDGEGNDVSDIYDIVCNYGRLTVTPREITVYTGNAEKTYDGTPLTNSESGIRYGTLVHGHRLDISVYGSQTDAGKSSNLFNATVSDALGNDVTNCYTIRKATGTLEVLQALITVKAEDATKPYDGTPLNSAFYLVEGNLAEGHSIWVTFTSSQTEVGHCLAYYTVTVTDEEGEDKTRNYKIEKIHGTFTVTKRVLELYSESDEKTYDGTPLFRDVWELRSGTVLRDHSLTVSVYGSQTDAGESLNHFSYAILDEFGNDVTSKYYNIIYKPGMLKVNMCPITVRAENATKPYDGTPLNSAFYFVEGSLADWHSIEVTYTASQTEAGNCVAYFTVTVTDEEGEDKTRNYKIEKICGTFAVTKRELTVSTGSAVKLYDGTPLTCEVWNIISGEVVLGQELVVSVNGSQTDAGESENIFSWKILDEFGNNLSHCYKVTPEEGTLKVNSRQITVSTGSDEKTYDGTPLTCPDWNILSGEVVPGQELIVSVNGSQTEVGASSNTFDVTVHDGNGNDVTHCYEITSQMGTLTVNEPESGNSGTGNINNSGIPSDEKVFSFVSDTTGRVLLKQNHYGDYLLNGWATPPTNENAFGIYLTPSALQAHGYALSSITVYADPIWGYLMPYYTVYGGVSELPDSITYYYSPYSYLKAASDISVPSAYVNTEAAYREYVYGAYNELPAETESAMLWIVETEMAKSGVDIDSLSERQLIAWVESYIKGAASYNLEFSAYPYGVDTAVYFLTDAREGVCRHYATSAVAMLRALGFAARYVTGFAADAVAGEEITVKYSDAHAWVEVYVDGLGWVTIDPTGGDGSGGGSGEGDDEDDNTDPVYTLTITSDTATKKYDAKPLTCHGCSIEVGKLADGHCIVPNFLGVQQDVGSSENTFEITVVDENGDDVTHLYDITYNCGTLTIEPLTVVIKPVSVTLPYKGSAYSAGSSGITQRIYGSDGNPLVVRDKLKFTYEGRITEIGTVATRITSVIATDSNGNDVSYRYNFDISAKGSITVVKRKLTVTSGDASKLYDGLPVFCNTYKLGGANGLLSGHKLVPSFDGGGIDIAIYENTFTARVEDSSGNDVTDKYEITKVFGKLTVAYSMLEFSTPDATFVYSGSPNKSDAECQLVGGSLMSGHTLAYAKTEVTLTEPGSVPNTPTFKIVDIDGNDVSWMYLTGTDHVGTLTVTRKSVTVTSNSKTVKFDPDNPFMILTDSGFTTDGLVSGHIAKASISGEIGIPGSCDNQIDDVRIYDSKNRDVTHCYSITRINGVLTITP